MQLPDVKEFLYTILKDSKSSYFGRKSCLVIHVTSLKRPRSRLDKENCITDTVTEAT